MAYLLRLRRAELRTPSRPRWRSCFVPHFRLIDFRSASSLAFVLFQAKLKTLKKSFSLCLLTLVSLTATHADVNLVKETCVQLCDQLRRRTAFKGVRIGEGGRGESQSYDMYLRRTVARSKHCLLARRDNLSCCLTTRHVARPHFPRNDLISSVLSRSCADAMETWRDLLWR